MNAIESKSLERDDETGLHFSSSGSRARVALKLRQRRVRESDAIPAHKVARRTRQCLVLLVKVRQDEANSSRALEIEQAIHRQILRMLGMA
jgi:hypothetical protein